MLRERRFKVWLSAAVVSLVFFLAPYLLPQQANAVECPVGGMHTIQAGENLSNIAQRYGITYTTMAQANGIANPNLIYAGQQLSIPACTGATAASAAPPVSSGGEQGAYVVQRGENLSSIAQRHGVTYAALAQANGIANPNLIYAGQRLVIPAGGTAAPAASAPAPSAPAPAPSAPAPAPAPVAGGKRIEINLSTQMVHAYEGDQLVLSSGVSTGRPGWDTPPGNFAIYSKLPVQTMSGAVGGESWYVPNVPHVMYFYLGDALHGTYWHNTFGTGERISHGCVNMPLDAAARLYEWAPIGTPVWVHW